MPLDLDAILRRVKATGAPRQQVPSALATDVSVITSSRRLRGAGKRLLGRLFNKTRRTVSYTIGEESYHTDLGYQSWVIDWPRKGEGFAVVDGWAIYHLPTGSPLRPDEGSPDAEHIARTAWDKPVARVGLQHRGYLGAMLYGPDDEFLAVVDAGRLASVLASIGFKVPVLLETEHPCGPVKVQPLDGRPPLVIMPMRPE